MDEIPGEETEGKMKKVSLKVILVWITVTLTLFSIVGIIFNAISLQDSKIQQMEYGRSLAVLYVDRIYKDLENIDYSLIIMLVDGEEIKELNKITPDNDSIGNLIKKKEISDKILEHFSLLLASYDSKYNLFFYNPEQEIYLSYGSGAYQFRENMKIIIKETAKENNFILTTRGQLSPVAEAQGLLSVYKMNGSYIGTFISFEDFVKPIMNMNQSMCQSVRLIDQQGNCFYERNSEETTYFRSVIGKPTVLQYDFSDGIFSIQMTLKNTVAFYTRALNFIFLITVLIDGMGVGFIFKYIRKRLILPVRKFQEEIKITDISEDYHCQGKTGIEEFDDIGQKIGVLSNENVRLRVKVYEEQVRRQKVELDYMSLQIRPHFCINCLNSIYIMAQIGRMEEIQKFSIYLSDYLREALPSCVRFVRIEEEMKTVDNYLKIQKMMRGQEFRYQIFCEEQYKDINVPTLSIQTFVENSVKHAAREQGKLIIEVKVKESVQKSGYVVITVEDNGGGFPEEILAQLQNGMFERNDDRKQIGIMNIMQRFELLYESKAEIKFSNKKQGGARVSILLPERVEN